MSEGTFQWIKDPNQVAEINQLVIAECEKKGGNLDGEDLGKIVTKYLDDEILRRMVKVAKEQTQSGTIPEKYKNSEVYEKIIEIGDKQNGN
jgi:hypothetical protein